MLTRYFLEEPAPLGVMLGCLAFALWVYGLRRRSRVSVMASVGVALGGVMIFVIAAGVMTEREQVEFHTRALVEATAPLHLPTINDLVAERAMFVGPRGEVWPLSRSIAQELVKAAGRFPIEAQSVKYVGVEMIARDLAVVRLGVRTTFSGKSYQPIHTQWLLTWKRQPGGAWQIDQFQWLKWQGQTPSRGLWL